MSCPTKQERLHTVCQKNKRNQKEKETETEKEVARQED